MQVELEFRYTETVDVVKETYKPSGALALVLVALDSEEPFATLSVRVTDGEMPSDSLPPDHCYVKNWSENEGFLECLEEAGLVKRTGMSAPCGHCSAPLVKVLF